MEGRIQFLDKTLKKSRKTQYDKMKIKQKNNKKFNEPSKEILCELQKKRRKCSRDGKRICHNFMKMNMVCDTRGVSHLINNSKAKREKNNEFKKSSNIQKYM